MKARALLVDMECGPLTETMRGPLGSLFDETQFVMDVYGAGILIEILLILFSNCRFLQETILLTEIENTAPSIDLTLKKD